MKYSFSQVSKYLSCARSYKLYYIDRYREGTVTAFLPFGGSIDESLNAVLLDFKKNKYVTVDYKSIFDTIWQAVTINKVTHNLVDCILVGYAKADFVPEILKEDDLRFINVKREELVPGYKLLTLTELRDKLEEGKSNRAVEFFSTESHKMLNIINWVCMRRKAHLMLDAYVRDIIPKIEEVHEVQKAITLTGNDGNTFIGYLDAIVTLKGDTEKSIMDNKTAASPYDPGKTKRSEQLGTYCYAEGLKKAVYAVMLKSIKLNIEKTCTVCGYKTDSSHKTCNAEFPVNKVSKKGIITQVMQRCNGAWSEVINPEATTQFLPADITMETQNVIIENIGEVVHAIQSGVFPKNLGACGNIYGNPCPYIPICWKNNTEGFDKS